MRPFVPLGRGPDGEGAGAGLPASAPRGGAVPRARAPPRGRAPSPPPLPTHRPRRPPRAHTREPRRHANEVPERRGAWAGGGERREGRPGAARPRSAPPHTCSCSRARCGARADLAPSGVGLGARARADPLLGGLRRPRPGAAHWPLPPQGPPRALGDQRARACPGASRGRGSGSPLGRPEF